ncbi:hypothetical protein Tco_0261970 [Tanacetum coccineum]
MKGSSGRSLTLRGKDLPRGTDDGPTSLEVLDALAALTGVLTVDEGTAQVDEGTAKDIESTAEVHEGTDEVNENIASEGTVPIGTLFIIPSNPPHPKNSHCCQCKRRNNEKALNILLSAIPDRHLLSFHDATNAKTLWTAIKARFGGNEASKKMQKNLLKQQFETFTIGSREELDSAYERFQNILSMLELYDAKVSLEDANLKFLRSLPSVWHVVATMIRGQPGLDELEFDDLYNNLKVYEHELKGVSNSNSQNIAFLSTEVKGSTLKQSTVEPAHIPKGYTQAASSKVQTAPNCASHSDEIICSFFAQQASMPQLI